MTLDDFFDANPGFLPIAEWVLLPPRASAIQKQWPDADTDLLARCMEPVSFSGLAISRGTLYWKCRLSGSGDRFAAMLALGQPPGIETTDTFWAGRKTWVEHSGENYANMVKASLAKKGVHLKAGDEYMPELARTGPRDADPEAVVPFNGARDYIKRLCRKRGWAVNGAVNVEHREPESDPLAPENCTALSERIIRQTGKEMIRNNPDLKRQCATHKGRMKLKEEIVARHGLPGGKVPRMK
jgi:hypothetical protein